MQAPLPQNRLHETFSCDPVGPYSGRLPKRHQKRRSPTPINTGAYYGPEGASFTVTCPDGSTAQLEGETVVGWDGGQLLNYNYWRQLRMTVDGNTFFLRFNIPQETEWQDAVEGESSLYNFPFLLEYSSDMDDVYVELYCPSCDDFEGNASGTVTVELDASTPQGACEVVGTVDARVTVYSQDTEISGSFWATELD